MEPKDLKTKTFTIETSGGTFVNTGLFLDDERVEVLQIGETEEQLKKRYINNLKAKFRDIWDESMITDAYFEQGRKDVSLEYENEDTGEYFVLNVTTLCCSVYSVKGSYWLNPYVDYLELEDIFDENLINRYIKESDISAQEIKDTEDYLRNIYR